MLIKPNGAAVEHTILLNVRQMGTHAFIANFDFDKKKRFLKNSINTDNVEMLNYYQFPHLEKTIQKTMKFQYLSNI